MAVAAAGLWPRSAPLAGSVVTVAWACISLPSHDAEVTRQNQRCYRANSMRLWARLFGISDFEIRSLERLLSIEDHSLLRSWPFPNYNYELKMGYS